MIYNTLDDVSIARNPWSNWGDWTPDCNREWNRGCVKIRNRIPSTKKFIRRMEPDTCRDVENVKFVERRNKLTVAPE